MLRVIGHIFTFIYFLAIFISSVLPATYLYVADILGIVAFAIFALLLARGLTHTRNIFKYFLRLTLTAFIVELMLILAERFLEINFTTRNVIFTYAAALGFIVGLTLAISSSYMLVMRLETNNGSSADQRPYYRTIQPGTYNLPPWLGLALGVATMFLSAYASWRMEFTFSVYGIFLTTCFYLALIDFFEDDPQEDDFINRPFFVKLIRKSIFQHEKHFLNSFLLILGFNIIYYLIQLLLYSNAATPNFFFTLLVFVPAVLVPRKSDEKNLKLRILRYSIFPLGLLIIALLRYLLVLS
ncbi:MAG: hypothetical protein GX777_02365 [Fastidiosipila sp.]|nr:hypothetical protein [Fastidiosipila sp.]